MLDSTHKKIWLSEVGWASNRGSEKAFSQSNEVTHTPLRLKKNTYLCCNMKCSPRKTNPIPRLPPLRKTK